MGKKARVAVTRDLFDAEGKSVSPGPGPSILDKMADVDWDKFQEYFEKVTTEQTRGFDMVISFAPYWTRQTLSASPQLFSIHRGGVGYDMVDVPACTDAGVALFIIPAAVRRPVATGIMAMMLALATRLRLKDIVTRAGKWDDGRKKYPGIGLMGKTLGSIGVGNIGHDLFRLAKPFGMKHIAYDPYITQDIVKDTDVQLVDMDTLLSQSDFVNVSCPLSEKTRHLVGEKELKKMKPTAYIINTSRGPVIDEAALVKALKEDWIAGAGIDVFEQEPTPADNPLFKLENVIVTPHSIAMTDEFYITMWELIAQQIRQMIDGEKPATLVNPEVWDKPEFQNKLKNFHQEMK
ncbi:MAG: hydroxyacid dehydrogenase [Dehalococcoidia bacterium]|nr:hydroxyacid dehydrogenase [Dehalococcoidia bacterium]